MHQHPRPHPFAMVKAKKHLGQNFLIDEGVRDAIINAGELNPENCVVEVGPGQGFLSEKIAPKVHQLIAVELDEDLLPTLKATFLLSKNVTLLHQDALKFNPPKEPYKLMANLPYYITSPLINHFLMEQFMEGNPPQLMVIMVQKEVAEKILAAKKHSVLSLQVHLFGEPELVCFVPKTAFRPRPEVDSAVLKIRLHKEPKLKGDLKKIFWLFHVSFAQKRKKLSNNLGNALHEAPTKIRTTLEKLGIDPNVRAEDLTLPEWQKLINEWH